MLTGKAVVAIWNGIAPEREVPGALDNFYAWHQQEHMPERVGIPGFRRGRRYRAADLATRPAFFTLYEVDTMEVLRGDDYQARLNAPTDWTKTATSAFRDTSRALARVLESSGSGMGGAMLTLRFNAPDAATEAVAEMVRRVGRAARVTGAHLCRADDAASAMRTTETAGRTDIEAAPTWFAMVEATGPDALDTLLDAERLAGAGVAGPVVRGSYVLEYALLTS